MFQPFSSVIAFTLHLNWKEEIYTIANGCVAMSLIRWFAMSDFVNWALRGNIPKSGWIVYDHPVLWGSSVWPRSFIELGKKYPDSWHISICRDPRSMSPGSADASLSLDWLPMKMDLLCIYLLKSETMQGTWSSHIRRIDKKIAPRIYLSKLDGNRR